MTPVLLAILTFLLASTSLPALEPYSVLLRSVGLLAILAPLLWRGRSVHERMASPALRALVPIGFGYLAYLAAATLAHNKTAPFFTGVAIFVVAGALIVALARFYEPRHIVMGTHTALLIICAVSLYGLRTFPGTAVENMRLRGVLENANTLGFAAFALGALSLGSRMQSWRRLIGLLIALACIFLSGSRASFVALAIAAAGLAVGGVARARILVAGCGVLALVVWIAIPSTLEDLVLFRTVDSRSAGYLVMLESLRASFWTGLGEVPQGARIAGSPFTAGVTGGAIGLLGLAVMYLALIRTFASSRPRAFALVVAGVVHSAFESWMLTFSSPMFLTFIVSLVGLAHEDKDVCVKAAPPRNNSGTARPLIPRGRR